jgi:hypothetical protein
VKVSGETVRPPAAVVTEIGPVKPLIDAAVTVVMPAGPPGARLKLVGDAESEKFGAETATTTFTLVVRVPTLGLFPEKVTVKVPGGVPVGTEMLTTCDSGGPMTLSVKGLGETDRPVTTAVTVIGPMKPFNGVAVTVVVPNAPGATLKVDGAAESEKSVPEPTTTVTLVVRVPTTGSFPEKVTV